MIAKKRKPKPRMNRVVPPADIKSWRAEMALSERDAADRLGMARNFLRRCETVGAPLYVGFALAAVAAGLEPYSPENSDKLRRLAADMSGVQQITLRTDSS